MLARIVCTALTIAPLTSARTTDGESPTTHVIGTSLAASPFEILQDTIATSGPGDVILLEECAAGFLPGSCTAFNPVVGLYQYKPVYRTPRDGEYSGWAVPATTVIDGKSLTMVGYYNTEYEGPPVVSGPLLITGDVDLHVRGVEFWARPDIDYDSTPSGYTDPHNVRIVGATGRIVFEHCYFNIGELFYNEPLPNPADGAIEITDSAVELTLVGCQVVAKGVNSLPVTEPKSALVTRGGANRIAIYSSDLRAGGGGGFDTPDGAQGIVLHDATNLRLVGSRVFGGFGDPLAGTGGTGAVVTGEGTIELVNSTVNGGPGGFGLPDGDDFDTPEGAVTWLPGRAHRTRFDAGNKGPGVATFGQTIAVELSGPPDEAQTRALRLVAQGWEFEPLGSLGIAHVPAPPESIAHGFALQSGFVSTQLAIPTAGVEGLITAQGVFAPPGDLPLFGSPSIAVVVDPSALPELPSLDDE